MQSLKLLTLATTKRYSSFSILWTWTPSKRRMFLQSPISCLMWKSTNKTEKKKKTLLKILERTYSAKHTLESHKRQHWILDFLLIQTINKNRDRLKKNPAKSLIFALRHFLKNKILTRVNRLKWLLKNLYQSHNWSCSLLPRLLKILYRPKWPKVNLKISKCS